jgi:hypothetical protein
LLGIVSIVLLVQFFLETPKKEPTLTSPIPPISDKEKGIFPIPEDKTKTSSAVQNPRDIQGTASTPTEFRRPAIPSQKSTVSPPVLAPDKEMARERNPQGKFKESQPFPQIQPVPTAKTKSLDPIKKTMIVKPGEGLYTIAAKTYHVANTSVMDMILELNPKISNPDKLYANQRIRLPEITEEALILKSSDNTYQIRLGTFLRPEYCTFLINQPILQGKEIEILPKKVFSGATWNQVTAGKFLSRKEGLKAIQDLKERGLSPYFEGFKQNNPGTVLPGFRKEPNHLGKKIDQ